MSRTKKVLITGLIILIVGFLGSAVSAMFAIPTILNDIRKGDQDVLKTSEEVIDGSVLNVNLKQLGEEGTLDVIIDKSNDNKVYINTVYDNKIFSNTISETHKFIAETNTLDVNVKNKLDNFKYTSIRELIGALYNSFIASVGRNNYEDSKIIIKVPSSVNLKIEGGSINNINVQKGELLKDSLAINTRDAELKILGENHLKNVDIKNEFDFEFDAQNFQNANKVNIETSSQVNVREYGSKNNKMINDLSIKSNRVILKTSAPVSKNLNVRSEIFDVGIPFNKFNINAKILEADNTIRAQGFDEEKIKNIQDKTSYVGKIGDGLDGDYNFNINSKTVFLNNIN